MSQENVEIVGLMYAAFNAGDYQACLDLMAPEVEYHELEGVPGARGMVGVYRGREDLMRWFAEFLSAWEPGFRSEPAEVTELPGDHVLVVETWHGKGVRSGADAEAGAVALYAIHDGRISTLRYFATKAKALEAVGLSE